MNVHVLVLREQLNITDSNDDPLLGRLCDAAEAHVAAQLGLENTAPEAVIAQAILMLAAHWYENREATIVGVSAQTTPLGYDDLIREHRNYRFG